MTFVALDGDYKVWTWKAGDQFRIDGVLATQAAFEAAIADNACPDLRLRLTTTAGPSDFDLTA